MAALFSVFIDGSDRKWHTYCEPCALFVVFGHDKRPNTLPKLSQRIGDARITYIRPGSLLDVSAECESWSCRTSNGHY
jgi:hypothetical protein